MLQIYYFYCKTEGKTGNFFGFRRFLGRSDVELLFFYFFSNKVMLPLLGGNASGRKKRFRYWSEMLQGRKKRFRYWSETLREEK